jgi:hypothetical protein
MHSSNYQVLISLPEEDTSDLPGMTPSDMKTVPKEAVLSFHNITYRVKEKNDFCLGWRRREILLYIRYVHELNMFMCIYLQ